MKALFSTASRLNAKAMTELDAPIAAFGCGLLTKALALRGIEFSERSLGSNGPFLVLLLFVQKWLPEYSEDYDELTRFVARAGADAKYKKYLQCGEAAFVRYDATHKERSATKDKELSEERFTQETDDLARALGIV